MDIIIKQRILGSLVLIAIAIVFVPALMSGNASVFHESLKSNIPEKPAFVIDLSEEQKLRVANDNEKMAARMMRGEISATAALTSPFPLTETLTENKSSVATTGGSADSAKSSSAKADAGENKPGLETGDNSANALNVTVGTSSVAQTQATTASAKPASKLNKPISEQLVATKPIDDKSSHTGKKSSMASANAATTKLAKLTATPSKSTVAPGSKAQKGWIVQVASFREPANAAAMQKRLARLGLQSSVEKNTSKNGMLYRVRLGPWAKKQIAAKQQAALEKVVGLDTLLLKLR